MTPRQIARKSGDKTYEGRPCKEGHTTRTRNTSNCSCVECEKERLKQNYQDNKEQMDDRTRQWRLDNEKEYKEKKKQYYLRPDTKKVRNAYDRKRYKNDPVLAMRRRLSTQLCLWCKKTGIIKGGRTQDLLGYPAEELKIHIESLFKGPSEDHPEGMTWENRDEWHIDHVKPQSHFTNIDQLKECFALSNLKPEWGEWNRSKGNRFVGSSEDYPLVKKEA